MYPSVEKPRTVTVNRQAGQLIIDWADGHHSEYPLAGIRAVCPCVTCRGGHAQMSAPVPRHELFNAPNGSDTVTAAEFVGGYAIQFTWADGHTAGIYSWGMLRWLCPCPACRQAYGDDVTPA
jgi:DUF971 family protein